MDARQHLFTQARYFEHMGFNVVPLAPEIDATGKTSKRPSRRFQGGMLNDYLSRPQDGIHALEEYSDATVIGLAMGAIGPSANHHLVVLDFDTVDAFESMKPSLSFLPNTWLVRTRRGYHVYVMVANSLSPDRLKWKAIRDVDIKRNGYVVAPLTHAPHFGMNYTFIQGPPEFPLPAIVDSLDALSPLLETAQVPASEGDEWDRVPTKPWSLLAPKRYHLRYTETGRPVGLSDKMWTLLTLGTWKEQRYRSRSEADIAVVLALAGQGYGFTLIEKLFCEHSPAGSKFRSRRNPSAYLRITYDNALKFLTAHSRADVAQYMKDLNALAWPHSSHSPIDKLVMNVLLHTANRTNRFPTVSIGVRELANWTGKSSATVQRSLRRLTKLELIQHRRVGSRFRTWSITLLPMRQASIASSTNMKGFENSLDCSDLQHPIWSTRKGGLGERGRQLYQLLRRHQGLSVAETVQKTDIPRSTVFYLRKRMIRLGIVTATTQGMMHAHPLPSPMDTQRMISDSQCRTHLKLVAVPREDSRSVDAQGAEAVRHSAASTSRVRQPFALANASRTDRLLASMPRFEGRCGSVLKALRPRPPPFIISCSPAVDVA